MAEVVHKAPLTFLELKLLFRLEQFWVLDFAKVLKKKILSSLKNGQRKLQKQSFFSIGYSGFCKNIMKILHIIGPLWGLKQFLPLENPTKIMTNDFYFKLKALFVLKILEFFSWLFAHVGKGLHKNAKVTFQT